MNIHEQEFIQNFIISPKRERYSSMFESVKGRSKLLQNFFHLHDLDEGFATKIPSSNQSAETVFKTLKSKAAPDVCFVISTNKGIDGKEVPLLDVLQEIVGTCDDGTFISCIPEKLGYYEGEDVGTRLVFEKK